MGVGADKGVFGVVGQRGGSGDGSGRYVLENEDTGTGSNGGISPVGKFFGAISGSECDGQGLRGCIRIGYVTGIVVFEVCALWIIDDEELGKGQGMVVGSYRHGKGRRVASGRLSLAGMGIWKGRTSFSSY